MPDLKKKVEVLVKDAADCQLIGSLAADPETRATYRKHAEEIRRLAGEVTARPDTDLEFLVQQAHRCRALAAELADETMEHDLLALASDLEQTARQQRD